MDGAPEAIGAFVAEMDFGLAPAIERALHDAVDAGVTGYLPTALADGLRSATADWCADRFGWAIEPAAVQPVGDVIAAFELMLRHYSDPSAPVIVPTPAYMPFLIVPPKLGRRVIEVPSIETDGHYALDLDGIAAAFEQGADVLVLCNPWNPVGRVLTRDELLAVADVVERHGGRVFSDEIHAPLVFAPHRHVPVRIRLRGGGPALGDRDQRVEGVQPAGPEVRAGRVHERGGCAPGSPTSGSSPGTARPASG